MALIRNKELSSLRQQTISLHLIRYVVDLVLSCLPLCANAVFIVPRLSMAGLASTRAHRLHCGGVHANGAGLP